MKGINLHSIETDDQPQKKSSLNDILTKDYQLFPARFNDKKKEIFYSELYILISSGINLVNSMDIIKEQFKNKTDKQLIQNLIDNIIEGKELSDAMLASEKFDKYEYFSIKIGEESGRISEVLKELSSYYSNKIKQRRKIVNALTYPVLVLFTAIVAIFFMLNYIVPMFVDVFDRFQSDLPPLTQFIINISDAFTDNILIIFLILAGIAAAVFYLRKKIWFRKAVGFVQLNVPIVGPIVQRIHLARFCQSMALLLQSGVSLDRVLALIKQMIVFYPLYEAITKVEKSIMEGNSLYHSLEPHSIFDKRLLILTKVAEEVNKLDEIYYNLNIQFTEELEHKINVLNNLLEPLLIMFVGLIVGVILIAMYLPMFQLSTSIF